MHLPGVHLPQELSEVKGELEVKQKELVIVKKENRKRRKIIEKYQKMLHAGATGLHPVRER